MDSYNKVLFNINFDSKLTDMQEIFEDGKRRKS